MNKKKLKILLIIEQCNPSMSSVPLEGYNFYQEISKIADTQLVTHERNKYALTQKHNIKNTTYIEESNFTKSYYKLAASITSNSKGKINWPVRQALTYPIYAEFNHKVYKQFRKQVLRGDYDVVHVITPMLPRYPAKILKACKRTPFLLGPVNGGVPFPEGFQEKARQESAQFNFLRALGRFLIPGYVETYKKADRILAGSTFTFKMLKELFSISDSRISLLYENGISKNFLENTKQRGETSEIVKLLFVGRLVPYKCADILIDSLSRLDAITKDHISLKIVGNGSQKNYLEKRVKELNLDAIVNFVGWISQQETLNYYSQADIFCFPSVREFGGAVVLEAMACGLPCIVVNNGGIGEYVTEETGFKIEPVSKEYVTQELTRKIKILVKDETLRTKMSENSFKRVQEFTWERKATQIMEVYREIIAHK